MFPTANTFPYTLSPFSLRSVTIFLQEGVEIIAKDALTFTVSFPVNEAVLNLIKLAGPHRHATNLHLRMIERRDDNL